MVAKQTSADAVDQLCTQCGLCCNGVLFGDVELRRGDDPERFKALGIKLEKSRSKVRLPQPCACLEGTLCRIYTDRPQRCRAFDCRLLQRVQRAEVATSAAIKKIRKTRELADDVLNLLRELGQQDEHLPLNQRYARLMAEPMDLADTQMCRRRGKLLRAVHKLAEAIQDDFLG